MDPDAGNLTFDVAAGARPAALGRTARRGFAASLVVHVAAIGIGFATVSAFKTVITAYGNTRPLSITASFAEHERPSPSPEERGLAQIVISPSEALLSDRRFVNTTMLPALDHGAESTLQSPPSVLSDERIVDRRRTERDAEVEPRDPPSMQRRAAMRVEPAIAPVDLPPPNMSFVGRPCRYPERARQAGWHGTVELLISIAPSGEISEVTIFKSSGYAVLDAEAMQTARTWRAVTTKPGGKLWSSTVRLPVVFRL